MKVIIEETAQGCIIIIDGRLDTITSSEFAIQIKPAMEMADKEIILDCSNLAYISSSGLRQILMIRKMSAAKGGSIIIINLNEEIKKTFDLTGFSELFEIR